MRNKLMGWLRSSHPKGVKIKFAGECKYMKYIIYKTTNKINNKFYIGKHQTNNINDCYLGSGVALKKAIIKYGKEAFVREILFIFNNIHDMNNKEKEIVTDILVKNKNCYNLGVGGEGGSHFKGKHHTTTTKIFLGQLAKNRIVDIETKRKMSKNNWSKKNPEEQKKHARKLGLLPKTKLHKENISKSLLGRKHPQTRCPYCKKLGGLYAMKRWHFENCKFKKAII
jgi:hypothetical protein